MGNTPNMGIGVIFIVLETVAYVEVNLNGYCLMNAAVDAMRVEVKTVLRG